MMTGDVGMGYKSGTATVTHHHDKMTLEQMQKLVGGFIEVHYMPKDKTNLVVNEEAKWFGLQPNETATEMLVDNYPHLKGGDFIAGDALILHGKARIKTHA